MTKFIIVLTCAVLCASGANAYFKNGVNFVLNMKDEKVKRMQSEVASLYIDFKERAISEMKSVVNLTTKVGLDSTKFDAQPVLTEEPSAKLERLVRAAVNLNITDCLNLRYISEDVVITPIKPVPSACDNLELLKADQLMDDVYNLANATINTLQQSRNHIEECRKTSLGYISAMFCGLEPLTTAEREADLGKHNVNSASSFFEKWWSHGGKDLYKLCIMEYKRVSTTVTVTGPFPAIRCVEAKLAAVASTALPVPNMIL